MTPDGFSMVLLKNGISIAMVSHFGMRSWRSKRTLLIVSFHSSFRINSEEPITTMSTPPTQGLTHKSHPYPKIQLFPHRYKHWAPIPTPDTRPSLPKWFCWHPIPTHHTTSNFEHTWRIPVEKLGIEYGYWFPRNTWDKICQGRPTSPHVMSRTPYLSFPPPLAHVACHGSLESHSVPCTITITHCSPQALSLNSHWHSRLFRGEVLLSPLKGFLNCQPNSSGVVIAMVSHFSMGSWRNKITSLRVSFHYSFRINFEEPITPILTSPTYLIRLFWIFLPTTALGYVY